MAVRGSKPGGGGVRGPKPGGGGGGLAECLKLGGGSVMWGGWLGGLRMGGEDGSRAFSVSWGGALWGGGVAMWCACGVQTEDQVGRDVQRGGRGRGCSGGAWGGGVGALATGGGATGGGRGVSVEG